jgi:hypothetical protein
LLSSLWPELLAFIKTKTKNYIVFGGRAQNLCRPLLANYLSTELLGLIKSIFAKGLYMSSLPPVQINIRSEDLRAKRNSRSNRLNMFEDRSGLEGTWKKKSGRKEKRKEENIRNL